MKASIFSHPDRRGRLLHGILSWLCMNIDFFLPQNDELTRDCAPGPQPAHKAFSELGLVLRIAAAVPAIASLPDFRQLVHRWMHMAIRQNVFFDVRRRIELLPYRVAVFTTMKTFGMEPPLIHAELQSALDCGFVSRIERSPASALDLAYHLEAAGLTHELPETSALVATSSLTSLVPLPYARNIDLYNLTHMLFDLSDFCARDPRPQLGRAAAALPAYLDTAMTMCLAERNWDLLAELVMSRIALGDVSDTLIHHVTDAICDAQQASGCIPDAANPHSPSESGTLPTCDDVYHPTIVCLFMVACEGRVP